MQAYLREKRAMGGYAYRVVREDLSEEVPGEQSPGIVCEGARLVKVGCKFLRTGNNSTKCYIYNGEPNGCELALSWHL